MCLTLGLVSGFPQGGPAEACDSLLPRHVRTAPSSSKDSPYTFTASGSAFSYADVEGITVDIGGATFKGFFVAAIDPRTQKRIGSFIKVKGTEVMPCAAITHTDPFPKLHVRLIWQPPTNVPDGDVIFVATIVKSYARYFTGMVASVPVYGDQYVKKKK